MCRAAAIVCLLLPLLCLCMPPLSWGVEPLGPEQTLRAYYEAINRRDCALAAELRPGYSRKRCSGIDSVAIWSTRLLCEDGDRAALQLHISYTEKKQALQEEEQQAVVFFNGYAVLNRQGDAWRIDSRSFTSARNIEEAAYLQDIAGMDAACLAQEAAFSASAAADSDGHVLRRKVSQEKPPAQPAVSAPEAAEVGGVGEAQAPLPVNPASAGSAAVLQACWAPGALAGRPEEKRIRRLETPDLRPPESQTPRAAPSPMPASWRGSIRSVQLEEGRKLVALTFDLCERSGEVTGYDGEIVDYLREQGAAATFFAGGKWLRSHAERAMQLLADPLFEVGNHAWTHGNLRVLKGERMRRQIVWTQAQYEILRDELARRAAEAGLEPGAMAGIPVVPAVFRFPYGTCSPESLAALADMDLAAVQWDVVSADPVKAQSAAAIARVIKRTVRPGSIIICHANGRGHHTAEALPLFVPWLRQQGYELVTVSALLHAGAPETVDSCYENRPGDNTHYDRIFGEGT